VLQEHIAKLAASGCQREGAKTGRQLKTKYDGLKLRIEREKTNAKHYYQHKQII
jgi:hypothetical protein